VVVGAFKERLEREVAAASKLAKPAKKQWLQKGEEGPMSSGIATHLMNKLTLLMSHARHIGAIKGDNPASKPGGFGTKFRETVWGRDEIERLIAAARPVIRSACAILLYTAQRPSDVLNMDWPRVEERDDGRLWIKLRQQKTGELIAVPAHKDLAKLLRASENETGLLLPSPTGKPWVYRNFARAWDKACRSADFQMAKKMFREGYEKDEIRPHLIGTQELQRRDFRRTAMVRMAEAGATILQISAVTGHTTDYCQRIIDRYIPKRAEVAAAAIDAWESGANRVISNVVEKRVEKPRSSSTSRVDRNKMTPQRVDV
jgi:integrase